MNVYITPSPSAVQNGGILRVVNAMRRYLPEFGWQVVDDPAQANLINSHATEIVEGCEHLPVVQSSHGLMWSEYFDSPMWHAVNARCVQAIKRADAVTAPSAWVAKAIARGIAVAPTVIHHGVDAEEWTPQAEHGGYGFDRLAMYALWNKARTDAVSDHREVEKLAALVPETRFVSTIGAATANLKVCGVQSYADMKQTIQNAGAYLALARETFGIGTLEALAAGVPVAGWDYGGQREIIMQGMTGYLAPYGDWGALAECVRRCLAERARLSVNAREDAEARWTWRPQIAKYAALFDSLVEVTDAPKVSVIVTSYNLARFLPDALRSVTAQTMKDWECIIVDDESTDDTDKIATEWMERDRRFVSLRALHNVGLPAARNYGVSRASGKYVIPLDADDLLTPNALQNLSDALDADKSTHIAYGHLTIINADATQTRDSGWPQQPFDWRGQLAHQNQLHYSAMMRRSVFERTQGYRRRSWQAEDAEWWCYVTSLGFNAKRVTNEATLVYRLRGDSKTRANKPMGTQWTDGDWTAWTPYLNFPNATPFGAQGMPQTKQTFWRVSHGQAPQVSVVIPVGPGHGEVLQDALDSLLAQSFTDWEAIVVNDSGTVLDKRGYSFATWVETQGKQGAGHARNVGVKAARAPLLVFLDADDFLQPSFLSDTVAAYRAHGKPNTLVYTDWYQEYGDGQGKVWEAKEFDCATIFRQMIYNVTVLHPKAAFEAVGGFDEELSGWEDYDYFIRLALHGVDAVHVVKPLMTYRYHTGQRREQSYADRANLLPLIRERYKKQAEDAMA